MRVRNLMLAAASLAASAALGSAASAQDIDCKDGTEFPCDLQIREVKLQKVPTVFNFQSRVSQAKLPVGEGVFSTVVVKVLRGAEALCLEQFTNVQVRDSVLNLQIGRNMSCALDQVIAENAELSFQVCLGGSQNCLKPVPLGSSAYAVKASYASVAQTAHESNVAGQAHYAHRLTADRDLFIRQKLGTGYFDFYTHPAAHAGALYPSADAYAPYADGGFLQWTPVRDRGAWNLHIVGKTTDDKLRLLDHLVLATRSTEALGDFSALGHATFRRGGGVVMSLIGTSDGTGPALPRLDFSANSGEYESSLGYLSDGNFALHVNGHRLLETDAGGLATLHGSTLTVTGDAGPVTLKLAADSDNADEEDLPLLSYSADAGQTTADLGFLQSSGNVFGLKRNGVTAFTVSDDGFEIPQPTIVDNTLEVNPSSGVTGLTVARGGVAVLGGGLSVVGDQTLDGNLRVTGPVTFLDTVTFQKGSIDIAQPLDSRYVYASDETRALSFGGALTLNGGLTSTLAVESPNGFKINNKTALSGSGLQLSLGSTAYTSGISAPVPSLTVTNAASTTLSLVADTANSNEASQPAQFWWQDGGRVGLEAGFSGSLDDFRLRVPSAAATAYSTATMTEALRIDAEGTNAGKVALPQGVVAGSTDVSKIGGNSIYATGSVVTESKLGIGAATSPVDYIDMTVSPAASTAGQGGLSLGTTSTSQGALRLGVTATEAFLVSRNSKPLVLNSGNDVQLATSGGKVSIGGAIDSSYLFAVRGNQKGYGNLDLTGALSSATLGVSGAATLSGATAVNNSLSVTGTTTLGNAVTVGRNSAAASLTVDAGGYAGTVDVMADSDGNNNTSEPATVRMWQNDDELAFVRVKNGFMELGVEDRGQSTGEQVFAQVDVRKNNTNDGIGDLTGGWLKDNWLTDKNVDSGNVRYYVRLGELVIQSGKMGCSGLSSSTASFPVAFDTGTTPVVTTSLEEPGDDNTLVIQAVGNVGFSWSIEDGGANSSESGGSTCWVHWTAIGKKS